MLPGAADDSCVHAAQGAFHVVEISAAATTAIQQQLRTNGPGHLSGIEPLGLYETERTRREELEGTTRVALLRHALHVALVPGVTACEAPYVFIEWAPGVVERPYPGTAIWRAVLNWYLTAPDNGDPAAPVIGPVVAAALERFSSLEAWLRWTDHERLLRYEAETAHPRKQRRHVPVLRWPW